jgi:peptidylprolyl isomerase
MPFEKGDFVLIDYTGRIKDTDEVFITTIEQIAKNERVYKEGDLYEPRLVVVGEGWLLKVLDDTLTNLELGKTTSIEITPDKAFGERDPEKVKLMSLKRLSSRGITPQLGMQVEIDGSLATIRTIGSGRVQLDFNPPLAGKTLIYTLTIQKKLKTKKDKIGGLIHRRIPNVDLNKINLKIRKTGVVINIPEEAFYIEGLQIYKRGIANDVNRFFPEVNSVKFIEEVKIQKADEGKP